MECKKIFGSPYQIAKAILCPPTAGYDHRIFLWMIYYMIGSHCATGRGRTVRLWGVAVCDGYPSQCATLLCKL